MLNTDFADFDRNPRSRIAETIRPQRQNLQTCYAELPSPQSATLHANPHEPKSVGKKIPTPKGWYVRYWWRMVVLLKNASDRRKVGLTTR